MYHQGQPVVAIHSPRLRALLAYLCLHRDEEISRERLAYLFWPESRERQAKTNLRQLLHNLRRVFPSFEKYVEINHRVIKWKSADSTKVDVAEFLQGISRAQIAAGTEDWHSEQSALEDAVQMYTGDLLPECYDSWVEDERSRLRQLFMKALQRLTTVFESRGLYPQALGHGERLLAQDEFNEWAYATLMRLHALNNNQAEALRIYQNCLRLFREELEIEPPAEMQEAYQRLKEFPAQMASPRPDENELPLIGREAERRVLLDTWQHARADNAHVLLICGEAGMGKTRFAEELLRYVQRQGWPTATAACFAAEGRLPYGAVIDLLKCESTHTALSGLDDVWLTEISRLLPELLVERPDLSPPAPLTESWQRQRLFEALARATLSPGKPQLLFIDDIQWADHETIEWLHFLVRFASSAKLLIVATVRLGALNTNRALLSFLLELRRRRLITEIELQAMNSEQTALLAQQVSNRQLDDQTKADLFSATEGNPLFIVEMARAAEENRDPETRGAEFMPGNVSLPLKVQAAIQSRLANVSAPARKLLDVAAIIGRTFSFTILSHSSEETEQWLVLSLEDLLAHRLIREQGKMVYDFSHDKIREVVTAGISGTRRCLLHRRVAESLEEVHQQQLDSVSAELAAHWEKAGFPLRALDYWQHSAAVARRLFANEEVENHLQRALRLVREHLNGEKQDRRELNILRTLSPCLVQCRGYGTSEVQRIGYRVLELCRKLDQPADAPVLRMLAISKLVAGQISDAENFGLQLFEQAQNAGDEVAEVEAHYVLGVTYHWQGRFSQAGEHLGKAIELYNPLNHTTHITEFAQDPSVVCRIRLALVLWHLGYPMRSQNLGEEALQMSEALGHPFTRAYALHWYAWLQNLRDDSGATLQHAQSSIAFSEKYHFPYFATQSRVLYGWALYRKGISDQGLQHMREGLSSFRGTGSEVGCAYYRAVIANALAESGSFAQSLTLLKEALTSVKRSGERWSQSGILRLKGETLRKGPSEFRDAAGGSFLKAIKIARQQSARADALRAAYELNRLWQRSGKEDEAARLLDDVWQWASREINSTEMTHLRALLER